MLTIYGISNCDTIKKARRWLDNNGLEYDFHDYRKDGLDLVSLANWAEELGWEQLLNRRGTTWRKLPEEVKASINKERALELMLEQPAMIKRPLLDTGATKILGFSEKQYSHLLS
ncbi:ArsC family reductase [Endozoicomonas ascidiicola]|uniref:ArsC family reductase n=1 Tax=Endozoicomonas ascidiicola TaxID=1698521 RepID=UPI000A9CBC12|nr:ArsC family reductase [Endozoicomonas ascidiicola]